MDVTFYSGGYTLAGTFTRGGGGAGGGGAAHHRERTDEQGLRRPAGSRSAGARGFNCSERAVPWSGATPRRERPGSDGVAGRLGDVGPPRWGGPPEGAVGELVYFPLGVLLEAMVVAALRAGVTETGASARFVRGVVLQVALGGGAAADGAGAGGVPDLGQVPQLDPGIVASGFVPVIAGVGGDRVDRDDQVRSGSGGAQPPGAIAAGRAVSAVRGEGEPVFSWRAGAGAFPVTLGLGAGAAVGDGMSLLVGDGQAPGGLRVARRRRWPGRGPARGRPGPGRRGRRGGPRGRPGWPAGRSG